MEKSTSVVATPCPVNPLKTTLGFSVIHSSMLGAQCRGHCQHPNLVLLPQYG